MGTSGATYRCSYCGSPFRVDGRKAVRFGVAVCDDPKCRKAHVDRLRIQEKVRQANAQRVSDSKRYTNDLGRNARYDRKRPTDFTPERLRELEEMNYGDDRDGVEK